MSKTFEKLEKKQAKSLDFTWKYSSDTSMSFMMGKAQFIFSRNRKENLKYW